MNPDPQEQQQLADADEVGDFLFEHEGVKCLLRRGNKLHHWCGYVQVDPTHPWYGKHFTDRDMRPQVHGGLSFSATHDGYPGYWVGFDCGHNGDYSPAMTLPLLRPKGTWRNKEYVTQECKKLVEQYKIADLPAKERYILALNDVVGGSDKISVQGIRNELVKMLALVAADAWDKGRREAFEEAMVTCAVPHPGEYEHCTLPKEHEGPHQGRGLTW